MEMNLIDPRDVQEHTEVVALLEKLSAEHPAREAYGRGAGTIELAHLVADRPELVCGLEEAFLAGYWRTLVGSGGFRP